MMISSRSSPLLPYLGMTTTRIALFRPLGILIPWYADLTPLCARLTVYRGETISTVSAHMQSKAHDWPVRHPIKYEA